MINPPYLLLIPYYPSYEERQLAQPEGGRPLSKRQIAALSPRLGVLNNIPFAIPFETRVSIFRTFIQNDANNRGYNRFSHRGIARITVRRESISQDGFDRLQGVDLKAPIAITFIDQFGQEELVFKLTEWFEVVLTNWFLELVLMAEECSRSS